MAKREMKDCYRCGKPVPRRNIPCPHCSWLKETYIEETDSRYLVFLTMIERLRNEIEAGKAIEQRGRYDLEATEREYASFESEDHCRIDQVSWMISTKDKNRPRFFITGGKSKVNRYGNLVTVGINENLDEAVSTAEAEQAYAQEEKLERDLERFAQQLSGEKPESLDCEMTDSEWEELSEEEQDNWYEFAKDEEEEYYDGVQE